MPALKKSILGTSREQAPVYWTIHQLGSFLVDEFFNGGYYKSCLHITASMLSKHRSSIMEMQAINKIKLADIERLIAQYEDVSRWASEVHLEDYHTVNTHVFITLWAAQEAGIENIISVILRTSKDAAKIASEIFQNAKYPLSEWPWSESVCLEIAQKLDSKAKNTTDNGGVNIAKRTIVLFSWFGLNLQIDDMTTKKYNEASRIRNVILHRYGQLATRDIEDFPELIQWEGKVLPITNERIKDYYNAVITMHLAMAKAVWSSEYK